MATFVLGCTNVAFGETSSHAITVNNNNSIFNSCPGTVVWINIPYLISTNTLGTISTQDANGVGITGGQIQGVYFTSSNQYEYSGGTGTLKSMAFQNSDSVSITGGNISGASWQGSQLGDMALQDSGAIVITGGSITGTDLNTQVDSIDGGGTGGGSLLPELSLEGAAIIATAILGLWASAWVFRQLNKQVEDS